MTNKYLEKIAITNWIGGYAGAEKGDKVGGTILGGGVLGGAATAATLAHTGNPLTALAVGGAAGYVGGKLYSKAKQAIQGKHYHKKR